MAWSEWSAATRAAAVDRACPLVVLLGVGTDHYAHRWLRSIHADDEVVELLNAGCVPVAVEVATQPGLARRVQQVMGLTAQAEGWPAIAVILPNGRLVGAIPFGPVRDAERRVGLARILVDLLTVWAEAPDDLIHDATILGETCAELDGPASTGQALRAGLILPSVESGILEQADPLEGGFGPVLRSPVPAAHDFLLTQMERGDAAPALGEALERSLQAVLAGGCYDHLGGGCFHAATTADWSLPLFDRRTDDNARLLEHLSRAASLTDRPLYLQAASATWAWLQTQQRSDGLFGAGVCAESAGANGQMVAGATWVWRDDAVADVVGREAARVFGQRFLADERSDIGDGWRVPTQRGPVEDPEELPVICRRLLIARAERPQPLVDTTARLNDQGAVLRGLAAFAQAHPDERPAVTLAADRLCESLATWLAHSDSLPWAITGDGDGVLGASVGCRGRDRLRLAQLGQRASVPRVPGR